MEDKFNFRKAGSNSDGNGLTDKMKLELELKGVKMIADHLHLDDTSVLVMYKKLYEDKGLSTAFIPECADGGERAVMSLTELLKLHNCPIKASAFSKILLVEGYLEERVRFLGKKDGDGNEIIEKFVVLTDMGLPLGKNVVFRHNLHETGPLYFEDTFMELYEKVME